MKSTPIRTEDHDLIIENQGLVWLLAGKIRRKHPAFEMDDLVQQGNLGLIHARGKFEASRGYKFTTYASYWIIAYVRKWIERNWSIVRQNCTTEQRSIIWGRSDLGRADFLLDKPVAKDSDLSFVDLLRSSRPDPESNVVDIDRVRLCKDLSACLSDREKVVFMGRIYTDARRTLDDIGEELGICRERVRQIEEEILEKLRGQYWNLTGERVPGWEPRKVVRRKKKVEME